MKREPDPGTKEERAQDMATAFKDNLPLIREMMGWNVEQAADIAECTIEQYRAYEQGIIHDKEDACIKGAKMAFAADVPLTVILGGAPFDSRASLEQAIGRLQNESGLTVDDAEYFGNLPLREKLWVVYQLCVVSDDSREYHDLPALLDAAREDNGRVPSVSWGQSRAVELGARPEHKPAIPHPAVFARCLKEFLPMARKMCGLTAEQAAQWTDCPISLYKSYERGIVSDQDIAANYALKFAVTFDVPAAMLLAMPPFRGMDIVNLAISELRDDSELSEDDAMYFDGLPLREKMWAVSYMYAMEKRSREYPDIATLVDAIKDNDGHVPSLSWGQPRLMDALTDFERYPESE